MKYRHLLYETLLRNHIIDLHFLKPNQAKPVRLAETRLLARISTCRPLPITCLELAVHQDFQGPALDGYRTLDGYHFRSKIDHRSMFDRRWCWLPLSSCLCSPTRCYCSAGVYLSRGLRFSFVSFFFVTSSSVRCFCVQNSDQLFCCVQKSD